MIILIISIIVIILGAQNDKGMLSSTYVHGTEVFHKRKKGSFFKGNYEVFS